MSNWPEVEFQDLSSADRWSFAIGPFGSKITTEDYRNSGVPFIRGVNLARGIFFDEDFVYIKEEKAAEIESAIVTAGDLIFTRKGTIGQVSMVPRSSRFDRYAISGSQMKARLNQDDAHPEFYYYWFRSPVGRQRLLANASAVGVPSLPNSLTTLRKLRVPKPPISVQREISSVLGALDDKIAVNDRAVEALDGLSKAIFQHTFTEPATNGIPVGWDRGRLSDLSTTQYGYTASATSDPIGPKFLRVKDINKQNWIDWDSVPYCDAEQVTLAKYSLHAGDILVARMADPGKSAIVEQDVNAVFASYLVRLHTQSLAHAYFVYGFLKSQDYRAYSEASRSGSVQANMNARVIVAAELAIPPASLMESHLNRILPLRKKLTSTLQENSALTKLRDTLLRKLMSGEIKVRDAEKIVEDAA